MVDGPPVKGHLQSTVGVVKNSILASSHQQVSREEIDQFMKAPSEPGKTKPPILKECMVHLHGEHWTMRWGE